MVCPSRYNPWRPLPTQTSTRSRGEPSWIKSSQTALARHQLERARGPLQRAQQLNRPRRARAPAATDRHRAGRRPSARRTREPSRATIHVLHGPCPARRCRRAARPGTCWSFRTPGTPWRRWRTPLCCLPSSSTHEQAAYGPCPGRAEQALATLLFDFRVVSISSTQGSDKKRESVR